MQAQINTKGSSLDELKALSGVKGVHVLAGGDECVVIRIAAKHERWQYRRSNGLKRMHYKLLSNGNWLLFATRPQIM